MKNIFLILTTIIIFYSCQKEEKWVMPVIDYEIVDVCIDSLEAYAVNTINVRLLHYAVDKWGRGFWCDTEVQPKVVWSGNSARFSFEKEFDEMALELKPSTCPGEFYKAVITINSDSVVRLDGNYSYYKLRIN